MPSSPSLSLTPVCLKQYVLNMKFGIYRKVVEHLEGSPSTEASHMRNTYLSIMQYLHDV
jgi:hypothetical protein